jgi:deoxyribodipyrimidine photo-lyase
VVFGLTDDYPEANLRHYTFMLEGLKDVRQALEKRGIKRFSVRAPPKRRPSTLAKTPLS